MRRVGNDPELIRSVEVEEERRSRESSHLKEEEHDCIVHEKKDKNYTVKSAGLFNEVLA